MNESARRKEQERGLVVLGMHRSGTSALAGVLRLCGAWLGEDQELTGANFENPHGFWERRDVRNVCDSLLHSAGADWWKVASFDPSGIPHEVVREQGRTFKGILSQLAAHGTWVLKEPRLCLLLPVLRSYVTKAVCIHIYRNPLEVALSLRMRNGFGVSEGLALWERYNRSALAASVGLPRILVSYEALVTDPNETLRSLLDQLAAIGVSGLALPGEHALLAFVTPSLHRQRAEVTGISDYMLPSQKQLWSQLQSGDALAAEIFTSLSDVAQLYLRDLESRQFAADRAAEQLEDKAREVSQLQTTLQSRNAAVTDLETNLSEIRSQLAELSLTLRSRDSELEQLRQEVAESNRQEAELSAGLAESDRTIKNLASGMLHQESHVRGLVARLRAVEKDNRRVLQIAASRAGQLHRRTTEATKLRQRNRELEGRIAAVYASRSWQVSAPLRLIGAMARRLQANARRGFRLLWWLATGQLSRAIKPLVPYYRKYVPIGMRRVVPRALRLKIKQRLSPPEVLSAKNVVSPQSLPGRSQGKMDQHIALSETQADSASQNNQQAPRIIVYTCLFRDYEDLKEPTARDARVRWLLFTDDKDLRSERWEVVFLPEGRSTARRSSRLPKILSHKHLPDHDISIYVDASLRVKADDVIEFAESALADAQIAMYPHHARTCVYDEIAVCRDLGIEREQICAWYEKHYEGLRFPRNYGLYEATMIVRRNTPQVREFNELWWRLFEQGAQRDQLSVMSALFQSQLQVNPIGIGRQVRSSPFASFHRHRRKPLAKASPRTFTFVAYAPASYERNLGHAYNDYMSRIGDDDYAIFIDHDAILCGPGLRSLAPSVAEGCEGLPALIVGSANRIGNPYQRLSQFEDDHDLAHHERIGTALYEQYRDTLHDVTDMPSASGVVLMLSKRTWLEHRFIDGFLGVDNEIHKSLRRRGGRVLFAPALYAYHFYRADGDTSHAAKTGSTCQSSSPYEAQHFVRNFIFSDDGPLTAEDYLGLLSPGEWAVFLSMDAMFCDKTWYERLCVMLTGRSYQEVLVFDSNVTNADAPRSFDHLEHRAFAASLLQTNGDATEAIELEAGARLRGFAVSRELLAEVCARESRGVGVAVIANALVELKARFRKAPGLYIQIARQAGDVPVLVRTRNDGVKVSTSETSRWPELADARRVAMITLGFWPQQAGMEMVFHNLATLMTAAGDLVTVFTPDPGKPFEEIDHNYIIRRYKSEDQFWRMFHTHQESLPFDCVLVQGAFSAASLALEAGKRFGLPVILRTHGEDIHVDPAVNYGYRLDSSKAQIIERNIREVDHNVVIGSHVQQEVLAIAPDARISVIGNGVDTRRFQVSRSDFLRGLFPEISPSTRVLLTVGRNVPIKSLDRAIDVLALLVARGQDVCLIHVGKEGKGVNLRQKAEELGVSARFRQAGEISYFDMPLIYASAEVFLYTSKMETFGNVTIEAMASGLPCVEFDYKANHDKLKHGQTGFIVPYGDVSGMAGIVEDLLENHELRERVGKAAREDSVRRFDWRSVVERYRTVIRDECERKPRMGPAVIRSRPTHRTSSGDRPDRRPKYNKKSRRRHFIASHFEVADAKVLEIGALNSPTFSRDESSIYFGDWLDNDDLAKKYPNKQHICKVDYVIRDTALSRCIDSTFDLVIANHVVEHIPDLITWLQELWKITNEGGNLFLAVPDRRYTFDIVRQETGLPELLEAHVHRFDKPSFRQLFGHLYYKKEVVASDVWAEAPLPQLEGKRFELKAAVGRARKMMGDYHSIHCHVFTKDSFISLFTELEEAGLVPWRIIAVDDVQPGGNEFLVFFTRIGDMASSW